MSEKTIVVVDDEPYIVDMLTTFLQIKGFEVYGAYSGEDGLTLVQVEKPDALLLDLMLPDIDGFEVMKRLRAMPDFTRLPILIVSARADTVTKTRAEESGANDYLTKPVQMPVLMESLTRALNAVRAAEPSASSKPPVQAAQAAPATPTEAAPKTGTGQEFWEYLDRLVVEHRAVIDRPKGSAHPRYPAMIYPVHYGYLEGTTASDRGGIDIWVGSVETKQPDAILCTLDLLKRDAEIKILLGCSEDEKQSILKLMNQDAEAMRGLLVRREKP